MRSDLLALSDDDLCALSNRGTVRRARAEVDAASLSATLEEGATGALRAVWSDGVSCELPANKGLAMGRCSCPAEPPCRHLIRTVMAYRARASSSTEPSQPEPSAASATSTAAPAQPTASEPGGLPAQLVSRARRRFEEGQLFELTRGAKPMARCHSLGVVTRFLVAGDPHHAVCDCGEPAPCEHALMALWAFARLPEDAAHGLVDTRSTPYPVPLAALDALESVLDEWLKVGLADAPSAMLDRLREVENACRTAGLSWLAEGLAELSMLKAAYTARDARFDAARLCAVVGELIVRSDATRHDQGLVPPLFIRGSAVDRTLEIGTGRLVGLGCGVEVRRASLVLSAFMQAEDTGLVASVVRETAHDATHDSSLAEVARAKVAKGISLAQLASGRTLAKGGKRSASGVFSFGRAAAACQPQAFAWERLRAPVLAEDFAEVEAHLAQLPPRPLRPRRLAEDLYVVPIAEVHDAHFDRAEQALLATLRDARGREALLVHPFHTRAAAGTEALLGALGSQRALFAAGRIARTGRGLSLRPCGVVFEVDGVRRLVQPWLEPARAAAHSQAVVRHERPLDATSFLADELATALGELIVSGLEGVTPGLLRSWGERANQAASLGFVQLPGQLRALAEAPSGARVLALAALTSFALELGS